MSYNPDFSRNAKGKFNINNNFVSIKNGSEAYLLEDELNEMQWIQNEQRAQTMRSMFTSGILYKSLAITDSNAPNDETICVKGYGNSDLNINAVLFNIKNYIPVNLNGYFFKLAGTYKKDITGAATTNNNILVKLPTAPTSGPRYDLVYLEMWFEELDTVADNEIKYYGGVTNSDINNFTVDPRINAETTHRIQLKWDIVTVANASTITSSNVHPRNNSINSNYKLASTIQGEVYSRDTNLYVSTFNTGVLDGIYYAIPLFSIYRLTGQTTFASTNCLSLVPVASMASTSISGGSLTLSGQTPGDNSIVFENDHGNLIIENSMGQKSDITIGNITMSDNLNDTDNISLVNDNGTLDFTSGKTPSGYADVVVGNLTVKGTTTTVNSEIITMADNIITLNSNVSASTTPTENGGIQINRGNQPSASLIWDESVDAWKAGVVNNEKTILLDSNPIIKDYLTIKSTIPNKILLSNSTDNKNYISILDNSGNTLSTLGYDGTYWYANGNKLAVINSSGLISDSSGGSSQVKDYGVISTNTTFANISGSNQKLINSSIDTILTNRTTNISTGTVHGTCSFELSTNTNNDISGLGSKNNVNINTWWGFSVSPAISGQTIAKDTPAFSVDARNGNAYIAGRLYTPNASQGIQLGDDVTLGDCNISNAMSLQGIQDQTRAGISFGSNKNTVLSSANDGNLYLNGTKVSTQNDTGNLSYLSTSNKSNLVGAINEVFQSGVDAKNNVVNAINNVGGNANTGMSWSDIANSIGNMSNDPFSKYNNNAMWHAKLTGNFDNPVLLVQNDKLYIIGGTSNYVLDIKSNILSNLANKPTRQNCLSATLYNNKIYCAGGNATNAFEIYDIASNTWSIGPSLPSQRYNTTCHAYNNKIYVFGGVYWDTNTDNFVQVNDIICYDIWSNTWSTVKSSVSQLNFYHAIDGGYQIISHTSTQKDNLVYIVNANNYGMISLFDMSSNTFTSQYAHLGISNTDSYNTFPAMVGDTIYAYTCWSRDSWGRTSPGNLSICPKGQSGDAAISIAYSLAYSVPLDNQYNGEYMSNASLAQYKEYIFVGFSGTIWIYKM